MKPNTMDCDTPEALRFLASACERPIEAEWMRKAAAEIERLRLTDAERQAIRRAAAVADEFHDLRLSTTLRGLLERTA